MSEALSSTTPATHSPVPAFLLMLQYLLHQQNNLTDSKCRNHAEVIAKLHTENLKLHHENLELRTNIKALKENYKTLEERIHPEIGNTMESFQKYEVNFQNSNTTKGKENSTEYSGTNEINHEFALEELHKFFQVFFKKENAECNKDRALQLAVKIDDRTVTEALVRAGTDIDTEDAFSWQRTPLHWAAVLNHTEIAQILIRGGANVESKETGVYSMYTPLHEAAKHDCYVMCNILLDAKANPDSRDRDGSTPLHIAARNGRLKIVQLLVRRGATVMAQDKWGLTPKDRARKYRHHEVADWLSETEHQIAV